MDVPVHAQQIPYFSAFFVLCGPHQIGWYPPTLVKVNFFIQSTNLNANLF